MDRSLQGSLLTALVTLEVVLVTASVWLVHWHLNDLIEESLYRVHLPQRVPMFAQLLQEAFGVLGTFALVNLLALMLAEAIWSLHENAILRDFTRLIGKTLALDFSADAATPRRHEVLTLTQAWRASERARLVELREQMQKLDAMVSAKSAAQDLRVELDATQQILPRVGDSANRPRARE